MLIRTVLFYLTIVRLKNPYLKCPQRLCRHGADIEKNFRSPTGFPLCLHRCTHVRMNVRYQPKPAAFCGLLRTVVHMKISGRSLRKHKLHADVADIIKLENFQPQKNLVFLKSLNILANVRYVCSSGVHFKTQSVDDVI